MQQHENTRGLWRTTVMQHGALPFGNNSLVGKFISATQDAANTLEKAFSLRVSDIKADITFRHALLGTISRVYRALTKRERCVEV